MIAFTYVEDLELLKKQIECLKYLQKHKVDVGLTSKASARSRFLLSIHTRGSPIMHIPPRPIVKPALAKVSVKTAMSNKMTAACEKAWKGDLAGVKKAMEESGKAGADGIRQYIDSQIPPPNAPITLTGGWIYNRVAKKGVLIQGKNGSTPMKDTGALYNDFDYEIVEK